MRALRILIGLMLIAALGGLPSHAQVQKPSSTVTISKARLDYSYCRFDSTAKTLCEEYLPTSIYMALANAGMQPRLVPVFLTIEDARFEYPGDTVSGKILFGSDGTSQAFLGFFQEDESGKHVPVWETREVPPAGNVRVQLRDLTGDGRPEIVATARGGTPVREAMMAFDFDGKSGRPLLARSTGFYDTNGMLGVGVGIVDSLAVNGRPAIEVWQDDVDPATDQYVRIRHRYSTETKMFAPVQIDTLPNLPRWCQGRRPQ